MTIIENAHREFIEDIHQEKIAVKVRKNAWYNRRNREGSVELRRSASNLPELKGSCSLPAGDISTQSNRLETKPESADTYIILNGERHEISSRMENLRMSDNGFNPFGLELGRRKFSLEDSLSISSPPRKDSAVNGVNGKEAFKLIKSPRKSGFRRFVYFDENSN